VITRGSKGSACRVAVAAAVLLGVLGVPVEAAGGRTGKFTLMALGDNRTADLDRLRGHYALLIASTDVKPDVIAAFRKRNPGARVFCYINTSDVNADLARWAYFARIWNETNAHEDWFHHDARGERVKIYYPKYKNRFAFNTGSPGLQKFLATLVIEALRTGLYDGIQLDNVSTDFPFHARLVGKWISAVPVKLTPGQWVADEVAMLRLIMKAVADAGFKEKKIIFNHMRSGEPEVSRAYVAETHGANCEAWMTLRTPPDGAWGWKAKVDQVREVNRAGKITNLLCTPGRPSEDEARFCFASYLMAMEGEEAHFFYAPIYKLSAQQAWYPFYDVDLGRPKDEPRETGGGFLRLFEKGCVVVNPTDRPVTVTLPGRYATEAGTELTEVPLAPKGAAILTVPGVTVKPAAAPTPTPTPAVAPAVPNVPADPRLDAWTAKIHAGWVGKVAAGSGALPTEMWSKDAIRKKYGVLNAPPQRPTSRGPLDDTTLAFLGWWTARKHGRAFTSADIARTWVDHLTDADLRGGGYGREFYETLTALRRGDRPPIRSGSPRAEWIAAQMRAEIWGMLAPGDPARAADYAARDAEIFNTGNGVYAARFVAALASVLMVDRDVPGAVAAARRQVPDKSRLAGLIDDVVRWHTEDPKDWERTWQRFVDTHRDRTLERRFDAWGPGWLVETGGWPDAAVLDDYLGRRTVLRTHPFSDTEPARITTELTVPPDGGTLKLNVTCNDRPAHVDWLLRVRIAEFTRDMPVRWVDGKQQWQEFTVDLKPWAGRHVTLVLENAMLGKMAWEAGYWLRPGLLDAAGKPLVGTPPAGRAHRAPIEFSPRILPETFAVLAGLLYGEGDFRKSVSIATMCGFDTDCNAGTVGCLLGLRNGLAAIPAEWKDPLNDTYELQVTGPPRKWRIADLARQIAETAAALRENGPKK